MIPETPNGTRRLKFPESIWFSPHEGSFIVRSSIEDRFISVGLPSSDKATGRINGVICADIKEDDLTKRYRTV